VEKEKFIPLQLELYAKSGRMLKKITQTNIEKYGDRYYPIL
jgi:hypothetical protein